MALEIGGLCLSGFVFFYSRRYTFAEAAAFGIMTVLMLISLVLRIAEMFHIPELVVAGEAILLCAAVTIFMMHRSRWEEWRKILKYFFTTYPLGSFGLGFGCLLLFTGLILEPSGDAPFSSLPSTFSPFNMDGGMEMLVSRTGFGLRSSILFSLCARWHSNTVSG